MLRNGYLGLFYWTLMAGLAFSTADLLVALHLERIAFERWSSILWALGTAVVMSLTLTALAYYLQWGPWKRPHRMLSMLTGFLFAPALIAMRILVDHPLLSIVSRVTIFTAFAFGFTLSLLRIKESEGELQRLKARVDDLNHL